MMDRARRLQVTDDLLRRLGAAVRATQLYASAHPLVARNLEALTSTLALMHVYDADVTIGIIENEVVVGDLAQPKAAEAIGDMVRRLRTARVERISLERGIGADETAALVRWLARADRSRPGAPDGASDLPSLPHVRLGHIQTDERVEGAIADTATIRRLYDEAVSVAGMVWESARADTLPDPAMARSMIDGLAQAVVQNRSALLALTALKDYHTYTFTHMVNVSILTMAQGRGLGIDGPLLRELGLAALMHDIGKVRTPAELLDKTDRLTAEEFAIMKRHVVDGAEILRRTPDLPALAPVVAFEHHLRLDGSGYPEGVSRPSINLATMLCSIADVYDAMRSQRSYQQAFPTDRILAVMKRSDGLQFDQNLVRRFMQLLGIYPPGNLVRLNNGALAVVIRVHAPDPYRPRVRIVIDERGRKLETPYDWSLWEVGEHEPGPRMIQAPVDPAPYGIDPLTYL